MTDTLIDARPRTRDHELRDRARRVIPGGMYGHQNATRLPAGFPQFMAGGDGCRIRDVDGNEYIDFMCSYGPIVLGHRHPARRGRGRGASSTAATARTGRARRSSSWPSASSTSSTTPTGRCSPRTAPTPRRRA